MSVQKNVVCCVALLASVLTLRLSAQESSSLRESGQERRLSTNESSTQSGGRVTPGSLDSVLVACLVNGNEGEIALSRLAQERAENPEVKAFAEQMVKDHTAMLSQLQSLGGATSNRRGGTSAIDTQGRTEQEGRTINQQDRTTSQESRTIDQPGRANGQEGRTTSQESRTIDQPGRANGQEGRTTSQESRTIDQPGRANGQEGRTTDQAARSRSEQAISAREQSSSSTTSQSRTIEQRQSGQATGQATVQQIQQIQDQVAQACLESATRELSQLSGAEFDKAYMGMQVCGHHKMAAELTVFQSYASPELQALIAKGQQTTEQHLEHAKNLCKQLDSQREPHTARSSSPVQE